MHWDFGTSFPQAVAARLTDGLEISILATQPEAGEARNQPFFEPFLSICMGC
jgi:hypothetical protein